MSAALSSAYLTSERIDQVDKRSLWEWRSQLPVPNQFIRPYPSVCLWSMLEFCGVWLDLGRWCFWNLANGEVIYRWVDSIRPICLPLPFRHGRLFDWDDDENDGTLSELLRSIIYLCYTWPDHITIGRPILQRMIVSIGCQCLRCTYSPEDCWIWQMVAYQVLPMCILICHSIVKDGIQSREASSMVSNLI